MDALLMLLLFGCIWVAVAFGVGPIIGRTIAGKRFEDHGRERLGLLEADRAEREQRINRAMARHNGKAT